MDGVAVTLQTSEEAKGEEADGEADKRHSDTHPGDDSEKKLMDAPISLQRHTGQTDLQLHTFQSH